MNFKTNIEYLFNEYTWFLIAQYLEVSSSQRKIVMLQLRYYYTLI